MTYQPLHHKYRPQTFSDLVGQAAIATTLTNALHQQRIAPAYLFTGARGTGKTSSARILAKSLNCLKYEKPTEQPCGQCEVCQSIAKGSALDVIEIDAASNTGVDNIRELIERSQFAPVQCRYKVYVVDECHMLSTAAFNALLKTLEEPPDRVVFVLATTDPQRVLPTIISRCQRFDFRRIPLDAIVKHLGVIATKEAIPITNDALTLVAQISQGGLRDAESLLDQLSLLAGEVTVDHVWDLVGSVPERDLMALLDAIAQDNPEMLLDSVRRLMDRGREPLIVLQNLASFYRDLLIAKTAPTRNDLVALTPPTWAALCQFAQTLDLATILAGQQQLRSSEDQIKSTTQPRLWLEVTLMGLLPSAVRGQKMQGVGISPVVAAPIVESRVAHSAGPTKAAVSQSVPVVMPSSVPAESSAAEINPVAVPSNEGAIVEPSLPSPQTTPTLVGMPAVNAPAAAANPTDGSGIDERNQTWQRLLSCVDLTGTRAMLSVNCYLLQQNEHEILVGIKSQSMLKMITGMLPQLDKACVKAFKSRVKVTLQVAEAATQEASPSKPESSDRAPSLESNSPPTFDDQSASTEPAQSFEVKEATAHFSAAETSQPLYPANQSPTPPPVNATNGSIDPATLTPLTDPWQQEDQVTRAAKQLADFFGGRVVDMTDSDTVAATPDLAEINAASLQEKASTVLQDTEAELDGDDDVPF